MRLALDTNRYTDLCSRGNASVVEAIELADEVGLPSIVLGELRAGFAVGTQGPRNEGVLRRLLLSLALVCSMPTTRRRIITLPFTANCVSKALPSRLMICGLRPSSSNIPLSCMPVTRTLTFFLSSPDSRSWISTLNAMEFPMQGGSAQAICSRRLLGKPRRSEL